MRLFSLISVAQAAIGDGARQLRGLEDHSECFNALGQDRDLKNLTLDEKFPTVENLVNFAKSLKTPRKITTKIIEHHQVTSTPKAVWKVT